MFTVDAHGILRSNSLRGLHWLEHGFQTRVSCHLPSDFEIATLKQVHSDRVIVVDGEGGVLGDGDALATVKPGMLLTIRTADCVPLLLVDPMRKAVAAVHAGWRGTVAPILPKAVETLKRRFGTEPRDLLVAIGPCIRKDSFEVGAEVALQFRELFPERSDLDGKTTIDLAEACRRQLVGCGVPASAISDCGLCSYEEADLFHSYRRDRDESGRMVTFIGIRRAD